MKIEARHRKWIRRILILGAIRLVTSAVLYYVIVYRFKEIVQIAIHNQSHGLYAFDASNIDFSLFKRHLIVDNARVYCTDTVHANQHYEVTIPKIHLAIQSWEALILHQRVLVDSLLIEQPAVDEHEHVRAPTRSNKAGLEPDQVLAILKSMTRHLQIKKFKVAGGSYTYRNRNTGRPFVISHLNFYLRNFSKRNNTSHHFFSSEEIDINLDRQHWYLPDGVHDLSFKRMHFSGRSKFIKMDSCVYHTSAGSGQAEISLKADRVLFNSNSISVGYTSAKLIIDTLICQNMLLNVRQQEARDKQPALNDALIQLFKSVQFRYIDIREGQLRFKNSDGNAEQLSKHVNLKVYNLFIPRQQGLSLCTDSIRPALSSLKFINVTAAELSNAALK